MKSKAYGKYLSRMSYELEDLSQLEAFHEATKFTPATISAGLPRIMAYMTERRAMLETVANHKLYRYSPTIALPEPCVTTTTLAQTMQDRRSVQHFDGSPLTLDELSGVLHDAVAPTRVVPLSTRLGSTEMLFKRPYASGGGLYPVEVYAILMTADEGHSCRVTHYAPTQHRLSVIREVSRQQVLSALNDIDGRLAGAGVIFVLTAVIERTAIKYGKRGYRFALLEAGEVAQNLSLCAVGRRLASLPWGGYYDDQIAQLLGIDGVSETVLHCLSVGRAKQEAE